MAFQYITPKYNSGLANVVAYGADPTGVADSTTAFQNAMAAGPCIIPAVTSTGAIAQYMISNCIVPNGAALIGFAPPGYVGAGIDSNLVMRPRIKGTTSAVRLFNVDNKKGILFNGLYIDGSNSTTIRTADGISAGGTSLVIRDCLFNSCRNGLGGSVSGSVAGDPTQSVLCQINNCNFQYCSVGILNLISCYVFGGICTQCTTGVSINDATSSRQNTINSMKFEWCGRTDGVGAGNGLEGGATLTVTNCIFDNCGGAGFYANGSLGVTINGCVFSRNGNNVSAGTTLATGSSHINFNGAFNITVTGCVSVAAGSNQPTNVFSPQAFANFTGTGTNNGGIVFVGNDLSGYQGSSAGATLTGPTNSNTLWRTGTVPSGTGLLGYVAKNNLGTGTAAQDVDTR